jgi:hypothetical protein
MPQSKVYLHYFNANAEGRLPHALKFGHIYGRLRNGGDINGQVVTVVRIGFPCRYFVWSTFIADQKSEERNGVVVHGEGWQLCPPKEILDKNVYYLTNGLLTEQLFIDIVDPRIAAWLLRYANKYKPPGDPQVIKQFLKQLWHEAGNEAIETKVMKLLKRMR